MRYLIASIGSGVIAFLLSILYPRYTVFPLMIYGTWTFIVFCLGRDSAEEGD